MHLVLTLPGLLAPGTGSAPGLARLVAAAGPPAREPDGIDAVLAARFGIARQSDWPLASIRAAALGVDPGSAYWLAADPVTLVAGRDDVRLTGAVADLTADDADALVAMLNAHFSADGVAFVAPRPDAWFVRAPAPQRLATRPIAAAIGRSLRALMPAGDDARTWRRWQQEIQMLFHEHPVNAQRERAGAASVSGVWFSQGGTLAPPTATTKIDTFADDGFAAALARHVGNPAQPLPESLDPVLAAACDAELLVVATGPAHDLAALDAAWMAPAWAALGRRTLESVTLVADGAGDAAVWTARPRRGWQRIADRFSSPDLDALLAAARSDD
ncbi:MAG: hypothetical protein ABI886_15360 [Betaproteobacteria bacterium]